MPGETKTGSRSADAAPRPRHGWQPIVLLLLGYMCFRAFNIAELWWASSSQAATGPTDPSGSPATYYVHTPTPAAPGLGDVLANWDGQWYERIATTGYPTALEAQSANDRWTWAFPPLFPILVRGVMAVTGLGFPIAATLLNLALGALATVLIYELLNRTVPSLLSAAGALSISVFVSAPLFGLAYSEPAALVFLLVALRATIDHRYWPALIAVMLLAFTRPVAAPLAAVFVVHWWLRWRRTRGLDRNAHLMLGVCTVVALASPFMWNVVAGVQFGATRVEADKIGSAAGVTRTSSMIGSFNFGWFKAAAEAAGLLGVLVLLVALILALGISLIAARRLELPAEVMVWGVAYTTFVLLVTPLTPGLFRYLLLAAPLLVAVPVWALTWRNRLAGWLVFGCVAITGLWSQWFWIRYLYVLDPGPALLPWAP